MPVRDSVLKYFSININNLVFILPSIDVDNIIKSKNVYYYIITKQ